MSGSLALLQAPVRTGESPLVINPKSKLGAGMMTAKGTEAWKPAMAMGYVPGKKWLEGRPNPQGMKD
jgi:hypothetical protein